MDQSIRMERYAPEMSFPAYAFVPGRFPHPVTDPQGHSFGIEHTIPRPLDLSEPRSSPEFLFALDLFNAGFYWEAHETWEALWIAAGRCGTTADFLKGLIKLAAAGVKSRAGSSAGVSRHALRAAELLRSVRSAVGQPRVAGLNLDELIQAANQLAAAPISDDTASPGGRPVLGIQLVL